MTAKMQQFDESKMSGIKIILYRIFQKTKTHIYLHGIQNVLVLGHLIFLLG